ncbi:MAG TPA: hypothetical protein PKH32_11605, partial [Verrucomicrobiota bacterium]|nr:hypothetical protein [Verrucomicrobiota bacterium]
MNQKPASSGLNLTDIYHVLFRHKWKILIIWVLGAIATVIVTRQWPVLYRSEAKLFIRAIREQPTIVAPGDEEENVRRLGGGDGIIASERDILTSYDLALEVADMLGPQRILAAVGGGTNRYAAANMIRGGLLAETFKGNPTIRLTFTHPDRSVVQPVLSLLITNYIQKHLEIHQAPGSLNEYLQRQTDQSRLDLAKAEDDLRKIKEEIGVLPLEDIKMEHARKIAMINGDIYAAQLKLAELFTTLKQVTNYLAVAPVTTNTPVVAEPVPEDKVEEYKGVLSLLGMWEQELLKYQRIYTPSNDFVVNARLRVDEYKEQRRRLEEAYPGLITVEAARERGADRDPAAYTQQDLLALTRQINVLQDRIAILTNELKNVEEDARAVNELEVKLVKAQREFERHEENFLYFSKSLARAQFDEQLGPGRVTNIKPTQEPTPPSRVADTLQKIQLMILGGAFVAGIALAFLIELYLDRSVKRPIELETRIGIPPFLSIPRLNGSGRHLLEKGRPQRLLGNGSAGKPDSPAAPARAQVPVPADPRFQPFFDALRDRLIMDFEHRNLVHKPKLVAITSCGKGAGVSTIASGLAASLSETGDGNVLLVSMHNDGGVAQHFHKGQLECDLNDVLSKDKREEAMVQDNLYVVSESGNTMMPRVLHKHFSALVPRLRASDFDYIIFDMPPVSQVSPTTRVAPLMDMTFLVVESEKTSQDRVKKAIEMLQETRARTGVVLNKARTYVPKALGGDAEAM